MYGNQNQLNQGIAQADQTVGYAVGSQQTIGSFLTNTLVSLDNALTLARSLKGIVSGEAEQTGSQNRAAEPLASSLMDFVALAAARAAILEQILGDVQSKF